MDPFIAQITVFGCNFAPQGWALCQGQLLAISQNAALFSLIGTYYGGNGQTTFALPDLRGRAPIGFGQGPGLSNYAIGEAGGQETVPINTLSYPMHTHGLFAGASPATASTPGGSVEAEGQTGGRGGTVNLALYSASGTPTTLAPAALTAAAGGGQPHNNLQPYLALNFCIALQGIFPARS
jgi:microcystin-dependent protein